MPAKATDVQVLAIVADTGQSRRVQVLVIETNVPIQAIVAIFFF
jgi:hypothetical protein